MNAEKYPVVSTSDHRRFEFLSEGPNGTIRKVAQYQRMGPNFFNLAFGDWDEESQSLSDLARSNNQDRAKVLATVAFTMIEFMEFHPKATVIAHGVTPARTRLYQMGINANWAEISLWLSVEGLRNGIWRPFEMNKNYDAFSVTKKQKG